MKVVPERRAYLDWEPALAASEVFQHSVGFQFLVVSEAGDFYWIENRPEEEGRSVIMMRNSSGSITEILPKPFSARSRVFEYGGMPYAVSGSKVYFVNLKDQRIYQVDSERPSANPVVVTTEKDSAGYVVKYVDLQVSTDRKWLISATEKEKTGAEVKNAVAVINLGAAFPQEATEIVSGADFYKTPQFSREGSRISWLEWNHPYMPWDSTRLVEAAFDNGKIVAESQKVVAGSDNSSIANFCYSKSGALVFSQDFAGHADDSPKNYYNLYKYEHQKIEALTQGRMDFFKFSCSSNVIDSMSLQKGETGLVSFDLETKKLTAIDIGAVNISIPVSSPKKIFLVRMVQDSPSQLVEISRASQKMIFIKASSESKLASSSISNTISISFPTEDGAVAYGYFYPPKNAKYFSATDEKPPVLVLLHGGPTGLASPGFSKQLVFWNSQGYAIFDVNYRGSIGFGRSYRDALLHKWGILEINDVKDGLKYLESKGYISNRAVVSGGSAGGYSVQRLLTVYPDMFAAGSSHYGIGNLVTLQELTHKYESHYLEQLIGGNLKTNRKEYDERSPINHLDSLKSPMIIFQGSQDKVVPPENSRQMAAILKTKGIRSEYYEYPEEGHGFRRKENLVDSLEKQATFFKSVLNSARD